MPEITVKLYADLGQFLPPQAEKNQIRLPLESGLTVTGALERFKVPSAQCHLVLVNGVFVPPSRRASTALKDGDALAVWPPVAGG